MKPCNKENCGNLKYGFNCVCAWVKLHPGTREFNCSWCGIYTASKARCRECEEMNNERTY